MCFGWESDHFLKRFKGGKKRIWLNKEAEVLSLKRWQDICVDPHKGLLEMQAQTLKRGVRVGDTDSGIYDIGISLKARERVQKGEQRTYAHFKEQREKCVLPEA